MRPQIFASVFAVAALAANAPAHVHFTIDTLAGQPGDAIIITPVGDLDAEGFNISASGRVMAYSLTYILSAADTVAEGSLAGDFASADLVLTSDFFYGTGRLTGGDFRFEIASVTPVTGASNAVVAWSFANDAQLAYSTGATRADRSIDVGVGEHEHFQYLAVDQPGIYDITLIAWDASGVYADSAPVTFRILAGENLCKPNLSGSGCLGPTDLLAYLGLYFTNFDGQGSAVPGPGGYATDCEADQQSETPPIIGPEGLQADFDGDCQLGPTDLLAYLNQYFNPSSECFASCAGRPAPRPREAHSAASRNTMIAPR